MSWLKRLTGGGATLAERLEKLHAKGDWAAMLSLAAGQDLDDVSGVLVDEAGDRLAAINLEQAEACLRAGDRLRAAEHLELAAGQARSRQFQEKHAELTTAMQPAASGLPESAAAQHCSSCSPSTLSDSPLLKERDTASLPEEMAWELLLETMPAPLAERYACQPPGFRRAVLASRQGDFATAAALLLQEPGEDDLQDYERALVCLRQGDYASGIPLLEGLLQRHPEHDQALQLAIDLALQGHWSYDLRPLLRQQIDSGQHVGVCHAALARLAMGQGDDDGFLKHGLLALQAGGADLELVAGLAGLLERRDDLPGAEKLLKLLPAGGCHGGAHPLLGEFWLRQGSHLDQALESFKAASRQEPASRYWPMRIGQTYLSRGWRKDGERLLRDLLALADLEPPLREEIEAILATHGNS